MAAKQGPRNVGPTITLTDDFKRQNYRVSLTRMFELGLLSKESTLKLLTRVDELFPES